MQQTPTNDKIVAEIKEEHRLGKLVEAITNECAVIPRGAVTKRADGLYFANPMFSGLELSMAENLTNYQLLRLPQEKWNYNLLKRPDFNYATDFLDTLDSVLPNNYQFAITTDRYNGIIFLKSLLWPGMIFCHKCGTNIHGFVYFGNARKNAELLFMF